MKKGTVERSGLDRRKHEDGLPEGCRYERRRRPERRPIEVKEVTMAEFEEAMLQYGLARLREAGRQVGEAVENILPKLASEKK